MKNGEQKSCKTVPLREEPPMMELPEEMAQVEVIRAEGDFKCDHYKDTQVRQRGTSSVITTRIPG